MVLRLLQGFGLEKQDFERSDLSLSGRKLVEVIFCFTCTAISVLYCLFLEGSDSICSCKQYHFDFYQLKKKEISFAQAVL